MNQYQSSNWDTVNIELIALSEKFQARTPESYLRRVLDFLKDNTNPPGALKLISGIEKEFDRMPTIADLEKRMKANGVGIAQQIPFPVNDVYCEHCSDRGYAFAVKDVIYETIYACPECKIGRYMLSLRKAPPVQIVIANGYEIKPRWSSQIKTVQRHEDTDTPNP